MLILASASPRRHELLLAAGFDHIVRPASVPEQRDPDETPVQFVKRLAAEKAHAVSMHNGDVVLAADTVVALDDQIFGKPVDDQDAARMLHCLSGRDHWVYTGICLRSSTREVVDYARTRVTFVQLTEGEIQDYICTGEPRDKAGAYGIQQRASKFVSSIEGCYHNVVGLPVSLVYKRLKLFESFM